MNNILYELKKVQNNCKVGCLHYNPSVSNYVKFINNIDANKNTISYSDFIAKTTIKYHGSQSPYGKNRVYIGPYTVIKYEDGKFYISRIPSHYSGGDSITKNIGVNIYYKYNNIEIEEKFNIHAHRTWNCNNPLKGRAVQY